jgi:hypothetical protein
MLFLRIGHVVRPNRTDSVTQPREESTATPSKTPLGPDATSQRRRRTRLKVTPSGQYLLENGLSGNCTVIDASSEAMAVSADAEALIGDNVEVNIAEIGTIIGTVVRRVRQGFVIKYTDEPTSVVSVMRLIRWLRTLH